MLVAKQECGDHGLRRGRRNPPFSVPGGGEGAEAGSRRETGGIGRVSLSGSDEDDKEDTEAEVAEDEPIKYQEGWDQKVPVAKGR